MRPELTKSVGLGGIIAALGHRDQQSLCLAFFKEDALQQEKVERKWFVRFATVLMILGISFGALPIIKTHSFPSRRHDEVC